MAKRTAYGALAILAILTLFSVDAVIAHWVGGTDNPDLASPRPPIFGEAVDNLLRYGSVVPIGLGILVVLASLEFMRLLEAKGARPSKVFAGVMGLAVFLSPWLSAAGWLGQDVASVEGLFWPLVLMSATILGAGLLRVFQGPPAGSIADISATCLTVFYIGFPCSFALQIRSGVDSPHQQGVWLLLITLLVTKASDIGAFFAGSTLGRHRLAPLVSPNKTVEGAIGGVAGSAMVAAMFAQAGTIVAGLNPGPEVRSVVTEITGLFGMANSTSPSPVVRAVIFGIAVAIAAQLGDLVESCFKRDVGAKDSGSILPQFGGILDLIDSPIFSVPVAWFLLTRVWSLI